MQIFAKEYIIITMVVLSILLRIFKLDYKKKIIVISAVSVIILGIINYYLPIILFALITFLYYIIKLNQNKKLSHLAFIILGLSVSLVVLIVAKYGVQIVESLFGTEKFNFLIPIGISYFVMKCLQLVLDVRRGTIKDFNLIDMIGFLAFLPTFAAGPVETYETFKTAHINDYKMEDYTYGIQRILIGYFKKFVITDVFITVYLMDFVDSNFMFGIVVLQGLQPLIKVMAIFAKAYFDLSAYSDLAIGFSRLFGFKIMENFNNPFWKRNVSEFWRSWHMSLSRWCTTNIYFPVYGLTRKVWLGMYASMIVMGMWHYVSLNWLFWALHHATGLVLFNKFQKFARKRKKLKAFFNKKVVVFISHILTFTYVSLGYAFVGTSSLRGGFSLYINAIKAPIIFIIDVVKDFI